MINLGRPSKLVVKISLLVVYQGCSLREIEGGEGGGGFLLLFSCFPPNMKKVEYLGWVGGGGGGGALSPHIKKDGNLREMISLVLN